jgi:hypothetical protein
MVLRVLHDRAYVLHPVWQNCKLVQLSFIATIFICEDVAVITKARDTAY